MVQGSRLQAQGSSSLCPLELVRLARRLLSGILEDPDQSSTMWSFWRKKKREKKKREKEKKKKKKKKKKRKEVDWV